MNIELCRWFIYYISTSIYIYLFFFVNFSDIAILLGDRYGHLLTLYESLMLRRLLATDPDTRWCPRPNCTYAVIATGCASCPKIECERPGCGMYIHFSVKSISRKIYCSYGQKLGIIQIGFFNTLYTYTFKCSRLFFLLSLQSRMAS